MAIITGPAAAAPQAFDGGGKHYDAGYPQVTEHSYDPGILVLPVASSTSKVVKVRVHGGYSVRKVKFDVQRQNNPPIIPSPTDVEGLARNDLLVDCIIEAPLPVPTGNQGGLTWSIRGEYTFVAQGVSTRPAARVPGTDMLPLGGYPYSLGETDVVAGTVLSSGASLYALSTSMAPLAASDDHVWPFTIIPPFVFNSELLKE